MPQVKNVKLSRCLKDMLTNRNCLSGGIDNQLWMKHWPEDWRNLHTNIHGQRQANFLSVRTHGGKSVKRRTSACASTFRPWGHNVKPDAKGDWPSIACFIHTLPYVDRPLVPERPTTHDNRQQRGDIQICKLLSYQLPLSRSKWEEAAHIYKIGGIYSYHWRKCHVFPRIKPTTSVRFITVNQIIQI